MRILLCFFRSIWGAHNRFTVFFSHDRTCCSVQAQAHPEFGGWTHFLLRFTRSCSSIFERLIPHGRDSREYSVLFFLSLSLCNEKIFLFIQICILQEGIVKSILLPTVRIISTTRFSFPNGSMARFVMANKYLETLLLLVMRLGNVMAKNHLTVPIQRFFLAFEKAFNTDKFERNDDDVLISFKEAR